MLVVAPFIHSMKIFPFVTSKLYFRKGPVC